MADHFKKALLHLKVWEGGRVNIAADRGGSTAFGISLRFLKSLPLEAGDINGDGHISEADIAELTPAQADGFYRQYFWEHYGLDKINDAAAATKLLSFFVNMRGKTAALVAQRAANDLGAGLVEDGLLGRYSRRAINALSGHQFVVCLMVRAWQVYQAIVRHDPSQAMFLDGWRNRAFAPVGQAV